MSRVVIRGYSVSLDGFGAGPDQSLENPIGVGGMAMHDWLRTTRTFHREVLRQDGGVTGVDDDYAARGMEGMGAWILGRNMFTPSRGPWPDDGWKGWWGEDPPYHVPVFVLTHHARPPLEMQGGTTFHFVTDGIESALAQARAAAGERDITLAGGAYAAQQYLRAGLVDEMEINLAPTLLGAGERLFDGTGDSLHGMQLVRTVSTPHVVHLKFARP